MGKRTGQCPGENPAQAWGIPGRLSGVPKSLGVPWVGGCRRTPEGALNASLFIDALQANGPFNRSNRCAAMLRGLARSIDAHRTIRPSSRRMRVGAARPIARIAVVG